MEFGGVGEERADVLGAFHLAVGDLSDVGTRRRPVMAGGRGRMAQLLRGGLCLTKRCAVPSRAARESGRGYGAAKVGVGSGLAVGVGVGATFGGAVMAFGSPKSE